jgi:hypothetical protein
MYFRNLTPLTAAVNSPMWDCLLSPSPHRGRPAVLGGRMSMNTRGHLGEDGISGNSPALCGRNPCYFRLNLRGCRLNHSNPATNSLWLNILPASPTGSIFCAQGGGGGGRAPGICPKDKGQPEGQPSMSFAKNYLPQPRTTLRRWRLLRPRLAQLRLQLPCRPSPSPLP